MSPSTTAIVVAVIAGLVSLAGASVSWRNANRAERFANLIDRRNHDLAELDRQTVRFERSVTDFIGTAMTLKDAPRLENGVRDVTKAIALGQLVKLDSLCTPAIEGDIDRFLNSLTSMAQGIEDGQWAQALEDLRLHSKAALEGQSVRRSERLRARE